MSQSEVARALGVSRSLVQYLEQRALAKLAAHFGVAPRDVGWWRKRKRLQSKVYRCSFCHERGQGRS